MAKRHSQSTIDFCVQTVFLRTSIELELKMSSQKFTSGSTIRASETKIDFCRGSHSDRTLIQNNRFHVSTTYAGLILKTRKTTRRVLSAPMGIETPNFGPCAFSAIFSKTIMGNIRNNLSSDETPLLYVGFLIHKVDVGSTKLKVIAYESKN